MTGLLSSLFSLVRHRWRRWLQVWAQCAATFALVAEDRGLSLGLQVADGLPAVQADPDRLAQVLRNLLDNGLTHTPSGGEIGVIARARDRWVEISVRDTGAGIVADSVPRREYDETVNKAAALGRAIDLAESAFASR